MLAVLLHVAYIVEEVDSSTYQAERDKGQAGTPDDGWLKEPAGG
jgi:hypothetical protein